MNARKTVIALACAAGIAVALPATAAAHGTHLKAKMSGDQVVGTPGAPNGTGRANLHVLKGKEQLCFEVQWNKIGNKTGLNIAVYSGKEGKNGNEEVTLVDTKETSPVEGCVDSVDLSTLKALNKNPEKYHVTVKNKKYSKDGAVRGQLKAV